MLFVADESVADLVVEAARTAVPMMSNDVGDLVVLAPHRDSLSVVLARRSSSADGRNGLWAA